MPNDTNSNLLSAVEIFDPSKHTFDVWLELFQLHCNLHKVEADEMVLQFLTRIGVAAYTDLRAMCGAKKPEKCSFKELSELLENHYNPKPNEVPERSKFRSRLQKENESLTEYVVAMQKLARTCNFGENLQENLRDAISHGVRDERLKSKLFEDKTLTYNKVIDACKAWENTQSSLKTDKQTIQVGNTSNSAPQINRVRNVNSTKSNENCKCCGKPNHTKERCRYRNCVCHVCSIKGHLASICRKKKNEPEKKGSTDKKVNVTANSEKSGPKADTSKKKVHNVETTHSEDDGDLFVRKLYSIRTQAVNSKEPTFLKVEVEKVQLEMELDNGADISCISDKLYEKEFRTVPLVKTASIPTAYDERTLDILGYIVVQAKLHNNTSSELKLYVVKNGSHPLLGREWYEPLGIELSVKIKAIKEVESAVPDNVDDIIKELKEEFPDVFTNELGRYKHAKVSLVLREGATPKYFRPRSLPFSIRDKVAAEIDRMVDKKLLEPVEVSEWGTPIVPVAKPNGDVRICGDYKVTVNPELVIDRYPLPNIDDVFNDIAGSEFYTTFDLAHAYQQLQLDEKSRMILVLSTLKGLYKPSGLMYGVASAPGIFEREMEMVLQGLEDVANFLDDVNIGGKTFKKHLELVREVLKRFRSAGLTINIDKCIFFKTRLKYLGFCIDKMGVSMDPAKVEAIIKAPQPKTKKEVQAFIGMIAYVIKFIPNAAKVLHPLYNLLKKDAPETIKMTDEVIQALVTVKKLVRESSYLAHFDPHKPILLRCDASPVGVGGVLLHIIDGEEVPVAYTSRTLSAAEKVYAQIDREALAIVYCVQKFDKYLYGQRFVLETDNSALSFIFGDKKGLGKTVANRISRFGMFLLDYQFEIRHVRKERNEVADGLSRLPLPLDKENPIIDKYRINFLTNTLSFINREKIATATSNDQLLCEVAAFVSGGWPELSKKQYDRSELSSEVRQFYVRRFDISREDGLLYFEHRIIIPKNLQRICLDELHRGHLGVVKMKSVARSHFWWPGIDTEIEQITNNCQICCENRKNPPLTTLHKWKYPSGPGERIHADFGHFSGKTFLLITDQYSKWLELYWLTTTTAEKTIQCFRQYFSTWGLVTLLVTDNGPPFSSTDFKNFLSQNGISHLTSPVEHPRSNGAAEVMVGTVKNKLKKIMLSGVPFDEAVHNFLLDYRTTIHQTTGKTPSELQLNRKIATRFDVILNRRFQKEQQNYPGKRDIVVQPKDRVLIRQYRKPTKWVEGEVLKPVGAAMAEVESSEGVQRRHMDQLIPLPKRSDLNQTSEQTLESRGTETPLNSEEIIRPEVAKEDPMIVRKSDRVRKPVRRLVEEI